MKKCEEIENNLPLYLDNSLYGDDKKDVEEHLNSCSRCSKALVELSKTRSLVGNLADVEPPPWFKQKVMSRVREEAGKKSLVQKLFYPLRIKIPVQVLTTIFIAVLVVYIYRGGEDWMKEVVPLAAPAPMMEVQKDKSPEQKIKTSADEEKQKEETIQKNQMPRDTVRDKTADAAKDVNGQIAVDMEADKYASAPAAKSVVLPSAELEKKKERNISGASIAMKESKTLRMQSVMSKTAVYLRVAEIDASAGEVEKLLVKYDAKNIARQITQNRAVLTAEVNNRKMKDLMAQLKTICQIKENIMLLDNTEENIFLVIEILNK